VLSPFQDFGQTRPAGELPVDWVEGVAIIVAILIVVGVGSINDWQKEKQFEALNAKGEEHFIKVVRDGREQLIDRNAVVVGDVVLLEPCDIIPCDGVFSLVTMYGSMNPARWRVGRDQKAFLPRMYNTQGQTPDPKSPVGDGESTNGSRRNGISGLDLLGHADCFVVSGSKVVEGVGSYVVISFGTNSFNGRIMMGLSFVFSFI
jgi:Ca2+-transporting ATPase